MDISVYAYIEGHGNDLCFKCAVKEIIRDHFGGFEFGEFNLVLKNDLRSAPRCYECDEVIQSHIIA